MRKYIVSFLASGTVPLTYYIGGFNFDERGFAAVTCFVFTVYVFVMGMIYPYSKEN